MTEPRDAEEIRRRAVSRALSRTALSPEEREAVVLMSRSLVKRVLEGPVSKALAGAAVPFRSQARRGGGTKGDP